MSKIEHPYHVGQTVYILEIRHRNRALHKTTVTKVTAKHVVVGTGHRFTAVQYGAAPMYRVFKNERYVPGSTVEFVELDQVPEIRRSIDDAVIERQLVTAVNQLRMIAESITRYGNKLESPWTRMTRDEQADLAQKIRVFSKELVESPTRVTELTSIGSSDPRI